MRISQNNILLSFGFHSSPCQQIMTLHCVRIMITHQVVDEILIITLEAISRHLVAQLVECSILKDRQRKSSIQLVISIPLDAIVIRLAHRSEVEETGKILDVIDHRSM